MPAIAGTGVYTQSSGQDLSPKTSCCWLLMLHRVQVLDGSMALFAPHTYFESLDPPKMQHVCTLALEKLDFAGAFASRGLTGATRLERELATENVPERCNDVLAELRQLDLNVAGAPVRFGSTLVQVKTETGNMALKRAVTVSSQLQDRAASGSGFSFC